MQISSSSSITLYGRKSLLPQKTPRSTEYTEVNASPGSTTRKMLTHRSSAKRNESLPRAKNSNSSRGRAMPNVSAMPAVITLFTLSFLPSERYFVIRRETVMGVPEQVTVSKNPNTESAT